jgi:thioredoxin 1
MNRIESISETPQFKTRVLEQDTTPAVVLFYANWCPYCRRFLSVYESLAQQYAGSIRFFAVEVDQAPDLETRNQIGLIPTVLLFDQSIEVKRWVNEQSPEPYQQAFDVLLEQRRAA